MDSAQLDPPSGQNRRRRLWMALLIPLLSIALLAALVFGIQRLSDSAAETPPPPTLVAVAPSPTDRPAATATPLPLPTLDPTATPLPPTDTPVPTPTPTIPPEEVVAVINNRVVTSETVQLVQSVDAAMAELLDRPAEPAETLLDRVINLALMAQTADQAGFELAPDVATQFRDAMLAENDRSLEQLTQSLAQRTISLAQFDAYLGQLLRSDQFLRWEAAAQGKTAADLLAEIQNGARISLGPVAAQLAAAIPSPTPVPTAEPAATETPLAETSLTVIRSRGTGIGQLLPDFALPLAGDPAALISADSLIGQPAVISFFTTWCPYCKRQTPILVDAYSRYVDQGVQFVGVDVKETAGLVLAYAQENAIVYPILLDESGAVASTYAVPGYPTTYFLDSQGQVVDRHIGALTVELLEGYLARIVFE